MAIQSVDYAKCPMNTLYHCTLHVNTFLVRHEGIKASLDSRGRNRVWLTGPMMIDHVIRHLAEQRKLSVSHWSIFEVAAGRLPVFPRFSGRPGIYYVPGDIEPKYISLWESRWIGFEPHLLADDSDGVYVYSEESRSFRPASAC